jgi:thiamine biosynthesis lipoprotein
MLLSVATPGPTSAAESLVLAGPAMGTSYRVMLAAPLPTLSRGEVHREIEAVLARIDAAASTWRSDSDVSRFNSSPAGTWIPVANDLAAIVAIAQTVHHDTQGRFDITIAPLIDLWSQAHTSGREPTDEAITAAMANVGMQHLELRRTASGAASLRKHHAGLALNLGGIGPGYAVDCVGKRLEALGSAGHLVVLGGEARAWGAQADGSPWEVQLPHAALESPEHLSLPRAAEQQPTPLLATACALAPGSAVAFSTPRPGRSPIDPRTGRPVSLPAPPIMARSTSCAVADALAVATAIARAESVPSQNTPPP